MKRILNSKRNGRMETRAVTGIMLTLFLLSLLSVAFNVSPAVAGPSTEIKNFRLLAVEREFDTCRMRSAQNLVRALLNYQNWNNGTAQYVSHIHLLSMYEYEELDPEMKPFLSGLATKANVHDEIVNFLGQAAPGEIVIFYYCGHSSYVPFPEELCGLVLDKFVSADELTSWLMSGGLPSACVTVILDTCYSGWWITDGAGGVLGPERIVLSACRSSQTAWGWCGAWGWFTYIGIIEGFSLADDSNNDGWISAAEVFTYAKPATESYSAQFGAEYAQNPTSYYGVVEGDLPLVQRDITKPFPVWDIAIISVEADKDVVTQGFPVSITVIVENQGVKKYIGDISVYYDTNLIETQTVSLVPEESKALKFTWNTTEVPKGTYTITATATIAPGETDTAENTWIDGMVSVLGLFADLARRGAWPGRNRFSVSKHGIQTILGMVINLEEGDCYIRIKFLLVNESGVLTTLIAKHIISGVEATIAQGETVTLSISMWEAGGASLAPGKYYVRATCLYSATGVAWKSGQKAKVFSFTIVP